MILNIVALIIGALILGAGIYYLVKEKQDKESRIIYGIVSGVGALILIGFAIKTLLEIL